MSWNEAAPAAIIGAIAATVGVFAIELWLKPAFSRVRVARILLAECKLNETTLDVLIGLRIKNAELVPWDVALSLRGWNAVAHELHYMPVEALSSLLRLYSGFDAINALVQEYNHRVDMILQMPAGSEGALLALNHETRHTSEIFGKDLAATKKQCADIRVLLENLIAAGPPT